MKKIFLVSAAFIFILCLASAFAGWDPREREEAEAAANDAVKDLLEIDPSMKVYFDQAYAYAVFPSVGKGAFIAGFGYGRGLFFEGGKPIGKATITQLSAGAQVGGQSYSEFVFFRDKDQAEDFKSGRYEFGAQATAIAVTSGLGMAGTYTDGVAVYIIPKAGLMADASISGQKFDFEPF
jgi:lipid-binding SYLF domain-containing protein